MSLQPYTPSPNELIGIWDFVECTYNSLLENAEVTCLAIFSGTCLFVVLASQQCWLGWPNKSDKAVMLEFTGLKRPREFLIVNPSQSLFNLLS